MLKAGTERGRLPYPEAPLKRRPKLSPAEREAVRQTHEDFPGLTYKQIALRHRCGTATVASVLNEPFKKPRPQPKAVFRPPSCTVQQPGSIIRPIDPNLLVSGAAARRVKLAPI